MLSERIDPQMNVIEVVKDGKHGLYMPERRAFLLPLEYDAISVAGYDAVIIAEKGARFQVYDLSRGQMMPGLFREFIIGATGRTSASDATSIALQQEDGSWIFWTRQPQPPGGGPLSGGRTGYWPGHPRFPPDPRGWQPVQHHL